MICFILHIIKQINTMNAEKMIFTTARGSNIPLEYPFVFHTQFPALEGMRLSLLIKDDPRFELIESFNKFISGYKIEYCKVKITNVCIYKHEQELHDKYTGVECCLSIVSSNNENIIVGDLEPQRGVRAVLIPEKL